MPKDKDMQERICIDILAAFCANPGDFTIDKIKESRCRTGRCAAWIWDEGTSRREGNKAIPLGLDRKGHCGRTQHKPFVINVRMEEKDLPIDYELKQLEKDHELVVKAARTVVRMRKDDRTWDDLKLAIAALEDLVGE